MRLSMWHRNITIKPLAIISREVRVLLNQISRRRLQKIFSLIKGKIKSKQDDRNVEDFGGYSMQFITARSNLLL